MGRLVGTLDGFNLLPIDISPPPPPPPPLPLHVVEYIFVLLSQYTAVCVVGKGLSKYAVKLHTSIPEGYFKASRLTPDRGNVRKGFLTGTASEAEGADGEGKHEGVASVGGEGVRGYTYCSQMFKLPRPTTTLLCCVRWGQWSATCTPCTLVLMAFLV